MTISTRNYELLAHGCDLSDTASRQAYLADLADLPRVPDAYDRWVASFGGADHAPPVRFPAGQGVDVRVWAIAAAHLARRHGRRDMEVTRRVEGDPRDHWGVSIRSTLSTSRRGGWDSMGHWGVSSRDVRQAWHAAGCRDSRKFRALLDLGGCADKASALRARRLKGLSARQVRDAARALRRSSIGSSRYQYFVGHLSTKLLIALGRLCPELQRVALYTLDVHASRGGSTWGRIRDVDWVYVSRVQAAMLMDPRVRLSWARGARREALGGESGTFHPRFMSLRLRLAIVTRRADRRDAALQRAIWVRCTPRQCYSHYEIVDRQAARAAAERTMAITGML